MLEKIKDNWMKIKDTIKESEDIGYVSYKTWIEPMKIKDFEHGSLVIVAPICGATSRTYSYIYRYKTVIEEAIYEVCDERVEVVFEVKASEG